MQVIERFDFFALKFDEQGELTSRQEFDALLARARAASATDAIFIAHGFRNDETDAMNLYKTFLTRFGAHLDRPEFGNVASRRFVVGGVFWPSKPFREDFASEGTRALVNPADAMARAEAQLDELKEEEPADKRAKIERAKALLPVLAENKAAQDEFVALVLSLVADAAPDPSEGLPQIKQLSGSDLLARLSDGNASGTRGLGDVFGTVLGGVGQFLNLTTWYVMKERSGTVGARGVAAAVRALHDKAPTVRIHLVGHSLGGRLMAACAKALCDRPKVQPDSLTLLEAAFSHFGFSADNGRGSPGFFRNVIAEQIVKGPIVSTFSAEDTVVGKAYSIMSRLAGDNTREIGDASDEFGGIGRNGPLKTTEVATVRLNKPGTPYNYTERVINNLDGSGGLISNHGDVTNEAVTYAFASAVART
jgi:hypothetical protein